MSTLEARYDAKVKSLQGDDLINYLLKVAPFIRDYAANDFHDTETTSTTAAATGGDVVMGDDAIGGSTPSSSSHSLGGFVTVVGGSTKNAILRQYMTEVEENVGFGEQRKRGRNSQFFCSADWTCKECGSRTLLDGPQAAMVCPGCGRTTPYHEMNEKNMSFDDQVARAVVSHCAYKRINHYAEWLNSLQAREYTVIPDDVIQAVRAEFKKSRAATRSDITPTRVREYLRKLRLQKYYEHTHAICNALSGTPAPKLPPALENKLKTMFAQIQAPFDKWVKVVAPQRKNFLSYSFVLYKFCQLLGEDEYLPHFPLLKSRDKLYVMDQIWKKICEETRWEYIPSI